MTKTRSEDVRRRWPTTLLVVLSVIAVSCALIAVRGKTGGSDRDAATEELVQSQAMLKIGGVPYPSVLFIGDSYTIGPFALSDLSYACLTATNMGWQCNQGSEPGTGYITGGAGRRIPPILGLSDSVSTSINERFAHLRELYKADIVVFDGGRNDLNFGPIYVRDAMESTLHRALEAWPRARMVVVLPWRMTDPALKMPDNPDQTFDDFLETELRSVPELRDVTFINPAALRWFGGEDVGRYLDADGIHPNVVAHRRIAEYLTDALRQNGLAGAR